MPSLRSKRAKRKERYLLHKSKYLAAQKDYYYNSYDKQKARNTANYVTAKIINRDRQKCASQNSSQTSYFANLEKSQQTSRARKSQFYQQNKEAYRKASRAYL